MKSNQTATDVRRPKLTTVISRKAMLPLAALCVVLGGIASTPTATQQTAPRSQPAPTRTQQDRATSAARIAAEVAQLAKGITPANWLSSHPGEQLITPLDDATDSTATGSCAVSIQRETLPDGEEMIRSAYFREPDAPSPAILPPDGDGKELIMANCLLNRIHVEIKEPNADKAILLAAATHEALSGLFGKGRNTGGSYNARGEWINTRAEWYINNLIIHSFYHPAPKDPDQRGVLVDAYLNYSSGELETESEGEDEETNLMQKAISLAGLDPSRINHLLSALSQRTARQEASDTAAVDEEATLLVSTIEQLITDARQWENSKRAAALLVADHILEMAGALIQEPEDKSNWVRQRLAALGADFAEHAETYVYANNWLLEAFNLAPAGEARDLALMRLMPRIACLGEEQPSRRVIEEGEKYLRSATDPKKRALVHSLVAQAYRDIVVLASDPDQGDQATSQYRAEAAQARRLAIEHYRAALALAPRSAVAREAWREAWQLIAGLPPQTLRFVCDGC